MSTCSVRRSHLDVDDDDPTVGQKFSTETLRRGDAGRGPIPSSLHGAPETAEESREVLARLKRMAGFESQDFDPGVRAYAAGCICEMHAVQLCRVGWLRTLCLLRLIVERLDVGDCLCFHEFHATLARRLAAAPKIFCLSSVIRK